MKTPKALGCLLLLASIHWVAAQSSNINVTPTTLSVSIGATATFRLTVVIGAQPFTYQWWFTNALGDNPIDGVANPSALRNILNLTNVQMSGAGGYYVVVTDANSLSTASGVATLGVDPTFTKVTTGRLVTDLGSSYAAAWGDFDGDGYPDVFVARYKLGLSTFYHNNRDGTFSATATAPSQTTTDAWSMGAAADFDNDGRLDLFVARENKPAIFYFNNGDGTFTASQFQSANPWNASAVDYNRDGLLDLHLSNVGGLFRNNGDRTFTRMLRTEVGDIVSGLFGGAIWADYDDDGWPDAYCANNTGTSRLLHNDGTGRLVLVANQLTPTALTGAWGDFDNDGRLDLGVACFNGNSAVYHNLGGGQFERAALGVSLGRANSATWADYDNDGFLDLFLTYYGGNKNALFHNNGDGTFTQITSGSLVTELPIAGGFSYGPIWFDYDNDGFLDLLVPNGNDAGTVNTANFLYHNNGNSNAWLKVRLIGTASNRDGIGAKVRALATYAGKSRWQRRDITGGDGVNGNQLYAHFGLGNATLVSTLKVEWPSGTVEQFTNVAPRQMLTIVEPSLRGAFGTDGLFHLTMTGNTNQTYELDASSDLLNWTTLTNWTGPGPNATVEFVDPAVPAANAQRLYRMK